MYRRVFISSVFSSSKPVSRPLFLICLIFFFFIASPLKKKSREGGAGACRLQNAPKVYPSFRKESKRHESFCRFSSRKCVALTTQGWLWMLALPSPRCHHPSPLSCLISQTALCIVYSTHAGSLPASAYWRTLERRCPRVSGVSSSPFSQRDRVNSRAPCLPQICLQSWLFSQLN